MRKQIFVYKTKEHERKYNSDFKIYSLLTLNNNNNNFLDVK